MARLKRAKPSWMLIALALALGVAMALVAGLSVTATQPEPSPAQTVPQPNPPNIVFILTDDMRKDDLNDKVLPDDEYMPQTNALLAEEGMSFENAFVSTPLCCPSRATIMRGQYAHNTGIWYNVNHFNPDGFDGGWEGYQKNGYEQDNVATRLAAAGYRTGLFGKYLNQYGDPPSEPPPPPPEKWDRWFAFLHPIDYYDYDVNDNGETKHFGSTRDDYSTRVLEEETVDFIDESVDAGEPFFAYVAPKAPHGDYANVPFHQHDFDEEQAPRLPSFDEEDVSDKPPWVERLRRLTSDDIDDINRRHERRVESLRSVDDLVKRVVDTLQNRGVLDNTYIVFTSDNGWFHGEHRIRQGKGRPYEEAARVPLLIRGPGVPAHSTTDKLVLNTDYFPTFTDLAGAQTPSYVDGRSLLPVLTGSEDPWRMAILLEERAGNDPEIPVDRNYSGIRTSTSKYVEYEGGFRELYDLNPDANPYELENLLAPDAPPPDPALLSSLKMRLDALKRCPELLPCRTAEDDITPPVLDLPDDIIAEATGPDGAKVSWPPPTATDEHPANPEVACTLPSGSTFPLGKTTVSCKATDTVGNEAQGGFDVTVRDTTPPTISGVPADIIAEATGSNGAKVSWQPPTATDIVDGSVGVQCSSDSGLTSGDTFPLGTTQIDCEASDRAGNKAIETFKVSVVYAWSGVLRPMDTEGISSFKLGSTVPVKFRLTGESVGIPDAVARLYVAEASKGGVAGPEVEAVSTSSATEGNLFRYDAESDQYVFNWSTKALDTGPGTYRLRIDLGDGTTNTVLNSLR